MARTICFLSLLLMPLLCTANLTNDGGVITLSFTSTSYQVVERNGPAQPVLRLNRPVDCCSTISVWVYVEEIDARQGTNKELHDYISKSHIQVLFPGGLTTAKFDVRMVDNMIIENTERFKVYIDPLSLPYGVVTVEPTSADVNIVDDDETEVSFDKSTYDVSEGDGSIDLTLQLTNPIPFIDNTLQLVIDDSNDHTATTCDYGSRMHTVLIPNDTTSFTYKIPIIDDDLFEIVETFEVQIMETSLHRYIKRAQPYATTVTVSDDEEPISVTLTTQSTIDEDAGVLKVTLSLGRPSPCCLRVYVDTIDIDGMAVGDGVDYGAEGGDRRHEVIFPAGTSCSSFEIPINDDGVSEQNEAFTIKIVEESLPFGVTLGSIAKTDVMIIDNDIYLMFNSSTYEDYERYGKLCVNVTLDKPAFFDTFVQILETRGTATSGRDYEEGPYNVTIPEGKMNATYCINITNDEDLEMDEAFRITINENALDQDVIVMSPNEARVIILDDEYTFCFEQRSYAVKEDDGYLLMKVSLSRVLPFEISVKFLYADRNAKGNHSGDEKEIDYYTTKTFPDFDTIPAYERDYILNVTIVPDSKLENNELFHVTAVPQHVPVGQPECSVDVIIRDDDDITLEFESDSYIVNKNEDVKAVILIKYPEYDGDTEMLIDIRVDEIDDTTTEGDYTRMNYAYNNVTKGTERIDLDLIAIDDNIVEADEVYYLTIVVLPTSHPRVTANEAKKTTKIIIYNDDAAFLSYETKSLKASKSMEFPANTTATVNINYEDDQQNMTTVIITPDQAINWSSDPITLSVLDKDIENIVVDFPCKFKSTLKSGGSNVQPSETSMVPIIVTYHRCD